MHCPFSCKRVLIDWPVVSLRAQNLAWIPIVKQDLASAMGMVRRARDVDQYSPAQPDGNRGREAENADQDAAARGVKTTTTTNKHTQKKLSKRYFRICWWTCASANRRGAVLEKMVFDFDVVCLQETKTSPNLSLVLQGFTVVQGHEGRGMAIVVWSDLSKTLSSHYMDK